MNRKCVMRDVEYIHPGQFTRGKNVHKHSEMIVSFVQQEKQCLEMLHVHVLLWFYGAQVTPFVIYLWGYTKLFQHSFFIKTILLQKELI